MLNKKELNWIENYFSDQDLGWLYKIKRNYEQELAILENIIKRKEIDKNRVIQ